MAKMSGICFTMNNYTEKDVAALKACEDYKYIVVGKEIGANGTPHLQGYMQLYKRARPSVKLWKKLSDLFEKRPHREAAKGTSAQNFAYCSKDGDYFEVGEPRKSGTRTDLRAFTDALLAGKTDEDIITGDDDVLISCLAKYGRFARVTRGVMDDIKSREEEEKEFADCQLRDWQLDVISRVDKQSDRTVTWVFDHVGGKGKSWLARWFEAKRGAFGVQGGKTADIAFAYNREKYVVFDLTRSQEEFVNYGTIEAFKNGRLFSPKYESVNKKFPACKVLVLSNWMPDLGKLSEDRWDIKCLDDDTYLQACDRARLKHDFVWGTGM